MGIRVTVTAGTGTPDTIELADNESVVIGRQPDPTRLALQARTHPIDSPSVSANHLLVRCEGDRTLLVDTDSRNGSWLQLPAGDRVEVSSNATLQVRLSMPSEGLSADKPRD